MNGTDSECDSTSRRLSFMKMVGLGKLKRESGADHSSQGPEDPPVQEEVVEEVKPREPLSGRRKHYEEGPAKVEMWTRFDSFRFDLSSEFQHWKAATDLMVKGNDRGFLSDHFS